MTTGPAGSTAGDGLVRSINAPSGHQVLPGVQPGVTGGLDLAQYVVVFSAADASGAGGGLFVYSGSPAPGNGPIYSVTSATEDPYGNAVNPGIAAGQFGQVQAVLEAMGKQGQLVFPTPTVPAAAYAGVTGTYSGVIPLLQMFSAQAQSVAPYNDRTLLQMQGNPASGASSASYFMVYVDTNGDKITHFFGNYAGFGMYACQFIYAVLPGTGTSSSNPAQPESWHLMTLQNGWAQVSGGRPARYRLTGCPANEIEVEGNISGAAASNSTFATLVSPYVPHYPGIFQMQPTGITLTGQYYGQANASGTLQAVGTTQTGNFNFRGIISLDS